MNKNIKAIIFIGLGVVALIVGIVFINTEMSPYSVFFFTLAGIMCFVGLSNLFQSSNPEKKYHSKVKNIINTYDSILVKSNTTPSLQDRNIVEVLTMDDLVDAQLEIRKPICYIKQSESCSFVLLDEKEAYVYIEKINDKVTSPIEIEIKEAKLKAKSKESMDSEMLRDIEKTTIVKLSNEKSYKVSPVRKKKKKVEQLEEIEVL